MKRKLTELEKKIINKLLSSHFEGNELLQKQLINCEASNTNDDDNYGSIYLHPLSDHPALVNLRVPVEGLAADSDGGTINILLHVEDGFLNELEIVKLEGTPIKGVINPNLIEVHVNN